MKNEKKTKKALSIPEKIKLLEELVKEYEDSEGLTPKQRRRFSKIKDHSEFSTVVKSLLGMDFSSDEDFEDSLKDAGIITPSPVTEYFKRRGFLDEEREKEVRLFWEESIKNNSYTPEELLKLAAIVKKELDFLSDRPY